MFTPSVAPFLPGVPHLYTATAFDAPPERSVPLPPAEWTAYHCLDPNHQGSFEDFMASPLFPITQQQLLDRCAECEAFADAHFSPQDAKAIRSCFATFRQNLLNRDGVAFFTDSLPKLYSIGKLHFDRFCLRLRQPELDLHQRKMKLYELARDLHNCRSSGSAFVHAALGLDPSPGGLQGEFHELLVARIDALLREVVNQLPPGVPHYTAEARRQQDHVRSMEVHMINRLKLELGLPGADADDLFVRGTGLLLPGQIEASRRLLRAQLSPVLLAQELAQRYMIRLRSELPLALQDPKADLGDHMEDLYRVHARLGATFGDVRLDHLLEWDAATGRTHWLHDLTLVAHDMLVALAAQKLIVPRTPATLLREHDGSYHWDLMHVDMRLFLVDERRRLEDPQNLVPVRVGHALAWQQQHPQLSPIPTLTDALLAGQRPDDLMKIPAAWLTDADQCSALCRGLGDDGVVRWLRAQPSLSERLRKLLLGVLTELGLPDALQIVMTHPPVPRAAALFDAAGGNDVIRRAVAQGNPYVKAAWYATLIQALPHLNIPTVNSLFTAGRPCLIGLAMMTGGRKDVSSLMALLQLVVQTGKLSAQALPSSLYVQPQDVMRAGRLEALQAFADRLCDMFRHGQLSQHLLLSGLAGPNWQQGCSGALEGGHVAIVTWFHELVRGLRRSDVLSAPHAAALLGAAPDHVDSGGMRALRRRHPEALAEHLRQLQDGVQAGIIPGDRLPDLLACSGVGQQPGLSYMLTQDPGHPCLPVWTAAVSRARHRNQLSLTDMEALLRSADVQGAPLLQQLLVLPDAPARVQAWLKVVLTLEQAHGLNAAFNLLDARVFHGQATSEGALFRSLTEGWAAGAASALMGLYGQACEQRLISRAELTHLLQAPSRTGWPGSALMAAVQELQQAPVAEYLQALLTLAEQGHITADMLVRLLEGGPRTDRTALSLSLSLELTEMVTCLLETSLAAAERGLISAEQWCRLLRPAQPDVVWNEIANCRAPAVREALDRALTRARESGLLDGPLGLQLAKAWQALRMSAPAADTRAAARPAEEP